MVDSGCMASRLLAVGFLASSPLSVVEFSQRLGNLRTFGELRTAGIVVDGVGSSFGTVYSLDRAL